MPYTQVAYQFGFKDVFKVNWAVEIRPRDDGYSAPIVELTGGKTPVKITYKNPSEEPHAPIIESDCTFSFFDYQGYDPAVFYTQDQSYWMIRVLCEGVQKWWGFLIPEQFNSPLMYRPQVQEIRAQGPLSLLKNRQMVNPGTGFYFDAPITILEAIYSCLQFAPVIDSGSDKLPDLVLASSLFEENNQDTGDDVMSTFFDQIKIDHRLAIDKNNEPSEAYSYLGGILTSFGCSIVQQDDRLVIFRPAELPGSTLNQIMVSATKTPTGISVGKTARTTSITRYLIGDGLDFTLINKNSVLSLRGAAKKVSMKLKSVYDYNRLANFYFGGFASANFPSWTKGAGGLNIAPYTLDFPYQNAVEISGRNTYSLGDTSYLESDEIDMFGTQEPIEFSGNIRITDLGAAIPLGGKISVIRGDSWLTSDGSWTTDETYIELNNLILRLPGGTPTRSANLNETRFKITSQEYPGPGTDKVRLRLYRALVGAGSPSLTQTKIIFYNLYVGKTNSIKAVDETHILERTGDYTINREYTALAADDSSIKTDSTGFVIENIAGLISADPAGDGYTRQWYRYPNTAGAKTLLRLVGEDVLFCLSGNRYFFESDVYGGARYFKFGWLLNLTYENILIYPTSVDLDIQSGRHRLSGVELKNEAIPYAYKVIRSDDTNEARYYDIKGYSRSFTRRGRG